MRFSSITLGLAFMLSLMTGCTPTNQAPPVPQGRTTSFADFDARATAGGQPLTVVFFGGSLTWGANASNPQTTSYRGLMAEYLRTKYPKAPFHFVDASIGGTGSNLGIFRLQRDVMAYKPDLVFLDFTANDGINGAEDKVMSCYEALLRDMIGAGTPVEQVFLGFKYNLGKAYKLSDLAGYTQHLKLVEPYQTGSGDFIAYIQPKLEKGEVDADKLWPIDGSHPGDEGYKAFFEAARLGYEEAVQKKLVCTVPEKTVYADLYHNRTRTKLVDSPLPTGWTRSLTYRTSSWFDGLSSRWMDDVAVCDEKDKATIQPIKMEFTGTMLALFGEADENGLDVKAVVDGKPLPYQPYAGNPAADSCPFNVKFLGTGKLFIWRVYSTNLPPGKHTLELMPVFPGPPAVVAAKPAKPGVKAAPVPAPAPDPVRQLHIESVCTAGD